MADVDRWPGVVEQIRLVVGLRWRILRNGLRKKNKQLDLIGMIFAGLFGSILVLGLSFAFFFGTMAFLSGEANGAGRVSLLFWGIFLFWQIIPIFVAGFGANFEFRMLLRFPLSLRAFYAIGLAYGFADFSAFAAICWLLAMTMGAGVERPDILPVMILVCALFALMNVTLERLLGSWLQRILAQRRSRELLFGLFLLLMISTNFIAPLMSRYGKTAFPVVSRLAAYLAVFPASLAGRAVAAAARHQADGIWLGIAGLLVYAVILSALLLQRFTTQYRGEELSESAGPAPVRERKLLNTMDSGDALRLLSPQVAAVVRKEFRYLTRNGMSLVALLIPPVMMLFFSFQFGPGRMISMRRGFSPDVFIPAGMAYLIMILLGPAYNAFAFEGKGMQTYFMAPVAFREVLLGKNLLLVAVVVFELAISMSVLMYRVGMPSTPILVATLAAVVFTVAGQLTIANWSSLNFPRKLEFGQMRGQRNSGMAVWITFGMQVLVGGICALILFAGRWTGSPWLPAAAFAALAAAALGGYFAALRAMTSLAEEKKEVLLEAMCK